MNYRRNRIEKLRHELAQLSIAYLEEMGWQAVETGGTIYYQKDGGAPLSLVQAVDAQRDVEDTIVSGAQNAHEAMEFRRTRNSRGWMGDRSGNPHGPSED